MTLSKFFAPMNQYYMGPFFPKKKLAIKIALGYKSHHSDPLPEEKTRLNMVNRMIDLKDPKIFRLKRKTSKNEQGCVSEWEFANLTSKEIAKELFDRLEKEMTFNRIVFKDNGVRKVLSDNFFTKVITRKCLRDLGFNGVYWSYLGRDSGLNMMSYYPLV